MGGCWSGGYKTKGLEGSEGRVRLDSADSIDEVSSEGEAGGVSGAEWMDDGVVGRVAIGVEGGRNLKIGEVEAGGVGGFMGCIGRGDGGRGGIERTVAI